MSKRISSDLNDTGCEQPAPSKRVANKPPDLVQELLDFRAAERQWRASEHSLEVLRELVSPWLRFDPSEQSASAVFDDALAPFLARALYVPPAPPACLFDMVHARDGDFAEKDCEDRDPIVLQRPPAGLEGWYFEDDAYEKAVCGCCLRFLVAPTPWHHDSPFSDFTECTGCSPFMDFDGFNALFYCVDCSDSCGEMTRCCAWHRENHVCKIHEEISLRRL